MIALPLILLAATLAVLAAIGWLMHRENGRDAETRRVDWADPAPPPE